MAEFQPQKKVLTDFNNGQKYNDGDGLNADTINNLVESTLYVQDNVGSGGSGATLTNYDGDSQEEGFTQWYIKRGAQAKNYYNLGAFDTYTENNDGTATITRQTGYCTINKMGGRSSELRYNRVFYTEEPLNDAELPVDNYHIGEVASSWGEAVGYHYLITEDIKSCALDDEGYFAIGFTLNEGIETIDDANAYLAKHPVYVQYKKISSYEEKVIANQPCRILNADCENWIYKEYKKSTNFLDIVLLKNQSNRIISPNNTYATTGDYIISVKNLPNNIEYAVGGSVSKSNTSYGEDTFSTPWLTNSSYKFSVPQGCYLGLVIRHTNDSSINISELSNTIFEVSKDGKIIHEKDLDPTYLTLPDNEYTGIGNDGTMTYDPSQYTISTKFSPKILVRQGIFNAIKLKFTINLVLSKYSQNTLSITLNEIGVLPQDFSTFKGYNFDIPYKITGSPTTGHFACFVNENNHIIINSGNNIFTTSFAGEYTREIIAEMEIPSIAVQFN